MPIIGDSSVAISFQYIRSGQFFDIYIERRWKKHGRAMQETLMVLQNNQPPDIEPDDYQTWIDDFIPSGIGKLCFFDAEQLDSLANQDQQSNILGETLTRLLGLDLVLRLEGDLDQLMNRQGSTKKIDQLYAKLLECQSERDQLGVQLVQIRRNLEEVESDISNHEEALAKQERLLASEGGTYAARRPLLQDQLKVIAKEVEALSNQLRDLSNELLPFALAPELCLRLYRRLTSENEIHHQQ